MESSSNSQAIDRAIALAEVQAVVHRYAFLSRNNLDWDEFAKTLHPDSQFHLANGKTLSSSDWKQILLGDQAKYIRHHLTTIDTQFSDQAEAVTTAQFFTITDWSRCDHWGEWKFVVNRNAAGVWLIKEMTIVLDGVDPNGWAAAKYQHS